MIYSISYGNIDRYFCSHRVITIMYKWNAFVLEENLYKCLEDGKYYEVLFMRASKRSKFLCAKFPWKKNPQYVGGHGCFSVVIVVCCQVEVSATN